MIEKDKSQAEDNTQLVQEFDLSQLQPSQHNYVQYGSELVCEMPGHHHAHQIDPRKTLTKKPDGSMALE